MSRWVVLGLLLAAAAAAGALVLMGGESEDRAQPSTSDPTDPRVRAASPLPLRAGRIVGYVRDVNGRAVPRATVRLTDGGRSVRASRSGRFELQAQPGRRTLMAAHPAYTRQSVATTLPRGRGARVDFSLSVTEPRRVSVANSADRLIFWTNCNALVGLREPELRRWIDLGVDGFVCQTGGLWGVGGSQRFTGDRRVRLHGEETRFQRQLRASPAARLARQGKLLLYLGFYATNYYNERTPLKDWFDDRGWSRDVLPAVRNLSAAAASMGFAGLAIDHELYPQKSGEQTASWSVRYPGNRRSEAEVRAKVEQRGRQLMETMAAAYPGLELVAYDAQYPENWQERVQAEANDLPDVFGPDVRIDFWDGLTSVQGYSAIRWFDAIFYKTVQLPDASWDTALEYNANRTYSYLSRRLSNWSYASSRLHVTPFSWVDEGPAEWEKARDPGHVAEQLDAFKRWGAGGAFANYAHQPLGEFDFGPYADTLRAASSPERVDRRPPRLELTSSAGRSRRVRAGETISLEGVANDDFAIRAVRWYDDRGHQGVATLTWEFEGDYRSGWNGEMSWSIDELDVPRDARRITISAEDIHGLARELRLTVER